LPNPDKHPSILIPATLIPKKGQDTAIKAMARLKDEGLDPVLWLAGNVVGEDDSYERYLKDLVSSLGLNDNVYFLGWRSDVPAMMAQADMVVLPTHEEGFGHVILEAMLLKRPAIATPVGGIKDSIQDGHNGLLFPLQDDARLAEQILRVHIDPAFVQRMIDNGYKTVTERFTPQAHTKHCLDTLREIINLKG
jgi:glycosyltransferase involved in cell wall biosynthesis